MTFKSQVWPDDIKTLMFITFFFPHLCAAAVAHRCFNLCALRRHFGTRDNKGIQREPTGAINTAVPLDIE